MSGGYRPFWPPDVAGYSRLMGADEDGTLRALKTNRKAVVDPAIANHRGRALRHNRAH
jgi:class 3 adenylate cyclase